MPAYSTLYIIDHSRYLMGVYFLLFIRFPLKKDSFGSVDFTSGYCYTGIRNRQKTISAMPLSFLYEIRQEGYSLYWGDETNPICLPAKHRPYRRGPLEPNCLCGWIPDRCNPEGRKPCCGLIGGFINRFEADADLTLDGGLPARGDARILPPTR